MKTSTVVAVAIVASTLLFFGLFACCVFVVGTSPGMPDVAAPEVANARPPNAEEVAPDPVADRPAGDNAESPAVAPHVVQLSDVRSTGRQMAIAMLEDVLRAPASAVYSDLDDCRVGQGEEIDGLPSYMIEGDVDSQNAFGAVLRSDWRLIALHESGSLRAIYLSLGEDVVLGEEAALYAYFGQLKPRSREWRLAIASQIRSGLAQAYRTDAFVSATENSDHDLVREIEGDVFQSVANEYEIPQWGTNSAREIYSDAIERGHVRQPVRPEMQTEQTEPELELGAMPQGDPSTPDDDARRERAAASKVRLAQELLEQGMKTSGIRWLREVVEEYGDTDAASEAESLLKVWDGDG